MITTFFARYLPLAISLGLVVLIGWRLRTLAELREKVVRSTGYTIDLLQQQNANRRETLAELLAQNENSDSSNRIAQGQQIATLADSAAQYLNELIDNRNPSRENTLRAIVQQLSTAPVYAEPLVQQVLQHSMYNLGLQQNPDQRIDPDFLQKCHLLVLLLEQQALQVLYEKSQPPTSCFFPNLECYFSTPNPVQGDAVEMVLFLQTKDLSRCKYRDFRYFINEKESKTTKGVAYFTLPHGDHNGIMRTKVVARRQGTTVKMDTFERVFRVHQ